MTALSLTLGALTLLGEQQGPLVETDVRAEDGGSIGKLLLTVPQWSSLQTLVEVLALADKRHEEDKAEIQAFRESLMHACELRRATHDNERELWAMRQTANLLSQRFSHERVQEKYDEYASDEAPLTQLEKARAEIERLKTLSRNIHAMAWGNGAVEERARMQPVLSVIGDWDWPAIVADSPSSYPDALAAAARALAYVAAEQARTQQPRIDDESRCAVCAWPLADSVKEGCVRGNCSLRPPPANKYAPERAEKESDR